MEFLLWKKERRFFFDVSLSHNVSCGSVCSRWSLAARINRCLVASEQACEFSQC